MYPHDFQHVPSASQRLAERIVYHYIACSPSCYQHCLAMGTKQHCHVVGAMEPRSTVTCFQSAPSPRKHSSCPSVLAQSSLSNKCTHHENLGRLEAETAKQQLAGSLSQNIADQSLANLTSRHQTQTTSYAHLMSSQSVRTQSSRAGECGMSTRHAQTGSGHEACCCHGSLPKQPHLRGHDEQATPAQRAAGHQASYLRHRHAVWAPCAQ
jgi:hypothetical protein